MNRSEQELLAIEPPTFKKKNLKIMILILIQSNVCVYV